MKKLMLMIVFLCFALIIPGRNLPAAAEKPSKELPVSPHAEHASGAVQADPVLTGKVAETMDSGSYTYINLEKDGKTMWVAIPQTQITKGQNISIKPGAEMVNFESSKLKRKFDKIIFSEGLADKKEAGKSRTPVAAEKVKVEKASGPNAYTIAEIYKNKNSLDKQDVVVKGKAVKVSPGIMNKNWIHLQDGTGDPANGDNDLVVTTDDLPSVGDIVTVSGKLTKDKDFGSGYSYSVIIENASVKGK
ncbi:MAG: DNA-binding protein [Nitrospirae bacterium]|nr:DNA-binding protein [Nitrospirota bacterium]